MAQPSEVENKPAEEAISKPKRQLTRNEKIRDFLFGFVGWWVINALVWFAVMSDYVNSMGENVLLIFLLGIPVFYLAQLITLIILASRRGWIALGIVSAMALNLVITLILGLTFNATCFIPFFVPAS